MTAKTNPFDLLAASLLADPAVKTAYDALEGEYEALRLKLTGDTTEAPESDSGESSRITSEPLAELPCALLER